VKVWQNFLNTLRYNKKFKWLIVDKCDRKYIAIHDIKHTTKRALNLLVSYFPFVHSGYSCWTPTQLPKTYDVSSPRGRLPRPFVGVLARRMVRVRPPWTLNLMRQPSLHEHLHEWWSMSPVRSRLISYKKTCFGPSFRASCFLYIYSSNIQSSPLKHGCIIEELSSNEKMIGFDRRMMAAKAMLGCWHSISGPSNIPYSGLIRAQKSVGCGFHTYVPYK
jgi:hypothetical protein